MPQGEIGAIRPPLVAAPISPWGMTLEWNEHKCLTVKSRQIFAILLHHFFDPRAARTGQPLER